MKTYRYEDLFQPDPDNADNVILTLPDEVWSDAGLKEGDVVNIEVINGCLTLRKVSQPLKFPIDNI